MTERDTDGVAPERLSNVSFPAEAMSQNGLPVDKTQLDLPDDAPDKARRERAVMLYVRYWYEKIPLADCWYQVQGYLGKRTDAKRLSAHQQAYAEISLVEPNVPAGHAEPDGSARPR